MNMSPEKAHPVCDLQTEHITTALAAYFQQKCAFLVDELCACARAWGGGGWGGGGRRSLLDRFSNGVWDPQGCIHDYRTSFGQGCSMPRASRSKGSASVY